MHKLVADQQNTLDTHEREDNIPLRKQRIQKALEADSVCKKWRESMFQAVFRVKKDTHECVDK